MTRLRQRTTDSKQVRHVFPFTLVAWGAVLMFGPPGCGEPAVGESTARQEVAGSQRFDILGRQTFERLCPTKTGSGDKDFGGNGPEVYAGVDLAFNDTEVTLRFQFSLRETKSDWTAASLNSSQVIYHAHPGEKIVRVVNTGFKPVNPHAEVRYTDTDQSPDTFSGTQIWGELVRQMIINGDTKGNDVGNCTSDDSYLTVMTNDLLVEVVKIAPPPPPPATVTLSSPHKNYPHYYKGQTHVHTLEGYYTDSDGHNVGTIAEVTQLYDSLGYTFVAITNHDEMYDIGDLDYTGCDFENCKFKLGLWGDNFDCDCRCRASMCLWGQEDSVSLDRHQGEFWAKDYADGIHVLNHPRTEWVGSEQYLVDAEAGWGRYTGMEINETFWDWALMSATPASGQNLWGFKTDDCHKCPEKGVNRGWIVVNSAMAGAPSREDIIANIRQGNFFAVARAASDNHPGPRYDGPIPYIFVVDNVVNVLAAGACSTIDFIGRGGALLHQASCTQSASYAASGSEKYIRIRVSQELDGEAYTVYSQPLAVSSR